MNIVGGNYDGQNWAALRHDEYFWFEPPPGWQTVTLTDSEGNSAVRDVRTKYLQNPLLASTT